MSINRKYVVIWDVGRSYGGSEEGGWWFDAGQAIGNIPVELTEMEWIKVRSQFAELHNLVSLNEWPEPDPPEVSAAWSWLESEWGEYLDKALLEKCRQESERWQEQYPDTGARSSILGGDDYSVTIEDEMGTYFPIEVMRYE